MTDDFASAKKFKRFETFAIATVESGLYFDREDDPRITAA
jgi:hypothetical protein